MEETFRTLKQT